MEIVFPFCLEQLRRSASRPLFVGIQGPQGSGKTTLVGHLVASLRSAGLRATGVSIDDFYLTHADQRRVAAAHPGNPYLEHRGYPGTHDIVLGVDTLRALGRLGPGGTGGPVRVPIYDKSLNGGRGDRLPAPAWRVVTGPLDLVFLDGWMLGFTPVDARLVTDPLLVEPNRALARYDEWHRLLGAFVQLRATDPSFVLQWRVEAEEAMKASGRPGLDRAAIEDYVRRFLPAYALYAGRSVPFPSEHTLVVWIDASRRPSPPPAPAG
jgi:D-glycerate 3-kinase